MFEVAMLFGKKWAYHHREAILATKLHWYPTSKQSAGDGHKIPVDAVQISVGVWIDGKIFYAEAIAEGAPAEMSNSYTGSVEKPQKAPGTDSDLRGGENEDCIITAENAGIRQKGYYLPKSEALMESAGASWAARALSLAPSLMEELYPEFARLRRGKSLGIGGSDAKSCLSLTLLFEFGEFASEFLRGLLINSSKTRRRNPFSAPSTPCYT